jgi:hypothetical protein
VLGQHELKPGQATELTIAYNTYKFPGKFNKFVTVYTDIDNQKELRIDINGFVKAIPMGVLDVTPRKIALGKVNVGAEVPGTITVKNSGDAPMKITKAVLKKTKTVCFEGGMSIPAGKTHTIPFSVTASKKGRFLDYILIHSDARNVTRKGYKVVVTATAH